MNSRLILSPRLYLQGSCNTVVTVNGAATTYTNCQALVTGMQFLWTVNAGSSNGGAVLNGAIIGPSTTGWAGFGFPDNAGSMVPGNAIIVKADSSAGTGEAPASAFCGQHGVKAGCPFDGEAARCGPVR